MFVDMSNNEYHSLPAISASWLKLMDSKSPFHVWKKYIDPNREPMTSDQKKALKHGRLVHTLALEPDRLSIDYVIVPDEITKRSKEGKKFLEELEAGPLCMVKEKDLAECKLYADAITSSEGFKFNRTLRHENEKTHFWDDDETGLACKFRPDTLIFPCSFYQTGAVVDVKTAKDSSPKWFGRQFFNLGYHIQAAHYAIGYMHAVGTFDLPDVIFEVVETLEPFPTVCYKVPESVIQYGLEERARLMSIAAECFKTGVWPGYSETMFTPLMVPSYIEREINEAGEIEVSYVE